jgi:hypothetical protein
MQMALHLHCGRPASHLQPTDPRTCRHKAQRHNLLYDFPSTQTPLHPSQSYQSALSNVEIHSTLPLNSMKTLRLGFL